jgi:2-haloacid dehalogenase
LTRDQIKAIVFDLGKVLIEWDPRHLYRKIFNNSDEMEYFLSTVCPPEWNLELDRGYPLEQGVKDRIKLFPDYEQQIHAYFLRWEDMVPGEIKSSVNLLSDLCAHPYSLYALSNWSAETFPRMCQRFEFLKWFEKIFISGEIGLVKPESDFYNYFLEKVDLNAGECIFIDDSEKNIQTARQLGFKTILFETPEKLKEELRKNNIPV